MQHMIWHGKLITGKCSTMEFEKLCAAQDVQNICRWQSSDLHFGTPILVQLVELIVLFTNLEPYWKKMRFILLQDSLVIWLHIVLLGQDIWSSQQVGSLTLCFHITNLRAMPDFSFNSFDQQLVNKHSAVCCITVKACIQLCQDFMLTDINK